ncbi:MAG: DNA recombination/repair protein RecA, partial [Ruthenibacterium lactatiformans]
VVIFINQLRLKVGIVYGNPEVTAGGNALKYYSSVRIDVRRTEQLKDSSGAVIGSRTRAKVVKNKVAPPFREAYFDIMFGEGISKSGELLDLAVQLGIVQKSGAWFGYGETRLGQGRDNTKIYLEEHPELFAEIEKQVRENADKLNAGKKGAAAKKKASIDDAPDVAKPAAKAEAPAPAAPAKRASIDIMVEDDE